ncbi:Zinc finger matrin-type protein 5 [Chamberlinius hualienensis]
MGKRYYCDYCDRSFHDNAENRKKHINGVQHQKNKKLHYDNFRNATEILEEESGKNPCKRFKLTGSCDFGSSCRYSHLTPLQLSNLQDQVRREKFDRESRESEVPKVEDAWVRALVNKIEMRTENDEQKSKNLSLELEIGSWRTPSNLSYFDLPPSLIPNTIEDFKTADIASWQ